MLGLSAFMLPPLHTQSGINFMGVVIFHVFCQLLLNNESVEQGYVTFPYQFPYLCINTQVVSSLTADLAVDWIGDKLYVTESIARRIQEYDLQTGELREVVDTGADSRPVSVAVYPYPGQG